MPAQLDSPIGFRAHLPSEQGEIAIKLGSGLVYLLDYSVRCFAH